MKYKVQLDFIDFRKNKHWIRDKPNEIESIENLRENLLSQLDLLESGVLNVFNKKFIEFTNLFQDICFQYPDNLTDIILPNHIQIFLESLTSFDVFEYQIHILNVLFILTKDENIKSYLYENGIIKILFNLFQANISYFIPMCNILSVYFINTDEKVHQQILEYKYDIQREGEDSIHKTQKFFKELIQIASDMDSDNSEFVHSALFLISNVINNSSLSDKQIKNINSVLMDRLNSHPQEIDLDDIIYCYICLIERHPDHIFEFAQIKIIWNFPYIFDKTQDENEFIGYLLFLQHIIYYEGTHINYFMNPQQIILFAQIIERISDLSKLSEDTITAALKALYFGVKQIPTMVDLVIQEGILNLLEEIHEQYQFSIRKIALKLLSKMLEKSDEESAITILNSKIVFDIVSSIDQFSIEFYEPFFKSISIPIAKIEEDNLQSVNEDLIGAMQELASSNDETISLYSQEFLKYFIN